MKNITVNPFEVWGFYPFRILKYGLLKHISTNHWQDIPRVPIFEIPPEHQEGHKYILLDGNKRMAASRALGLLLPSSLYDLGEEISPERDNLAHFPHHNDPKIYEKLLAAYLMREELEDRAILEKML